MPGPSTQGVHFFPRRMFPSRYWPLRYWPAGLGVARGAAVPSENWASGQDTTFTPGDLGGGGEVADLVALVPIDEPLSAGPPPVTPSLVRRISVAFAVRSVGVRAGYRVTSPLETAHRARYTVGWKGLTDAERESLVSFFAGDVQVDDHGGRLGFDLEPDGAGNGLVVVRPLANIAHTLRARASIGVHGIDDIECEELYTLGSGEGGVGAGSGGTGGGVVDDGDDGSGAGSESGGGGIS